MWIPLSSHLCIVYAAHVSACRQTFHLLFLDALNIVKMHAFFTKMAHTLSSLGNCGASKLCSISNNATHIHLLTQDKLYSHTLHTTHYSA